MQASGTNSGYPARPYSWGRYAARTDEPVTTSDQPALLCVMPGARSAELLDEGATSNVRVFAAENCAEARALLRSGTRFDAVVVAATLPDGNWWCVYRVLVDSACAPDILVALNHADDDAAPVLDRGADGVLRPPFGSARNRDLILGACRPR